MSSAAPMVYEVFVENPTGATTKIHHDEERLVPLFEEPVSWPYPFADGFVIGVPSGDGDRLDVTDRSGAGRHPSDRPYP